MRYLRLHVQGDGRLRHGAVRNQDPITNRLMDARPVTVAGAVAIATVCLARLGDNPDSFLHQTSVVAKRALADAQRMLECEA